MVQQIIPAQTTISPSPVASKLSRAILQHIAASQVTWAWAAAVPSAVGTLWQRGSSLDCLLSAFSAGLSQVSHARPRTTNQQAADAHLHRYITVLPVPAAPPDWMRMCSQIEAQGAAAFDAGWMHEKPCDLPDIQGSAGSFCTPDSKPTLATRPGAHSSMPLHPTTVLTALCVSCRRPLPARQAPMGPQVPAASHGGVRSGTLSLHSGGQSGSSKTVGRTSTPAQQI